MRRVIVAVIATAVLGSPASAADGPRLAFTSAWFETAGVLSVLEPDGTVREVAHPAASVGGDPSWSPDGRHIAYAETDGVAGRIHVADTTEPQDKEIVTLQGFRTWDPVWSPDGSRIAFTALTGGFVWGMPGVQQVLVTTTDGRVVLPVGIGEQPAWSPDGSRLAFTGRDGGIYLVAPFLPYAPTRISPPGITAIEPS
jgi:Tol biopolymer transport system component